MNTLEEGELCFPENNASCRRKRLPHPALSNFVLISITVFTVVLNLLVIISISHFRQLHTSTNLLLLSLAVTDFCVGLVQMPILLLHNQGCGSRGDFGCITASFSGFLLVSASTGNMVLISVDRYIAICEPMVYATKVTVRRVQLSVCLCWIFSFVHSGWMLRDFIENPTKFNSCYGECVFVVTFVEGLVDLIATCFAPLLVIAILYLQVFVVAVSQARAMRSRLVVVSVNRPETTNSMKSELKAARTLGIVIAIFVVCSSPYYLFAIATDGSQVSSDGNNVSATSGAIQMWLMYFNSCLNPVIYVFFYPWFRRAIKHTVTLKILHSGSSRFNVM